MSKLSKTRPLRHVLTARKTTKLGDDLHLDETTSLPDDVRALVGARPIFAPGSGAATTLAVRTSGGALLATVSVWRRDDASAHVGALAWTDAGAHCVPLALYLASRRARILGASTIVAVPTAPDAKLERMLRLVPLPGGLGQRIDIAAHAASEAWGKPLDPVVFGDEVAETFERWVIALYGRGFFKAVADGTLNLAQYVYAISNMHQFVRWTTRILGSAVASSHDRELRDAYLSHLHGEVNHELIIERDLAHLGQDVDFVRSHMAPSPGTRQFMAVQESLIGFHHDPVLLLASPLAAEGVASHLTPEFLDAMERMLAGWGIAEPKRAMMFFSSHVSTDGGDDGHWESVLHGVRAHLRSERDVVRFLGQLRASTSSLTTAYDEYVSDLAVFDRSV